MAMERGIRCEPRPEKCFFFRVISAVAVYFDSENLPLVLKYLTLPVPVSLATVRGNPMSLGSLPIYYTQHRQYPARVPSRTLHEEEPRHPLRRSNGEGIANNERQMAVGRLYVGGDRNNVSVRNATRRDIGGALLLCIFDLAD